MSLRRAVCVFSSCFPNICELHTAYEVKRAAVWTSDLKAFSQEMHSVYFQDLGSFEKNLYVQQHPTLPTECSVKPREREKPEAV